MEKLLKSPMPVIADDQETKLQEFDVMLVSKSTASDLESEIENGNLQDYLDIFGELEE
ncbi:MAG TPA: hypothetical protein PLK12_03880 [Prolixibacteraceae bacterium]|nr:hypothetical protein [Prolixibacteraceae bacterium]